MRLAFLLAAGEGKIKKDRIKRALVNAFIRYEESTPVSVLRCVGDISYVGITTKRVENLHIAC